MSDRGPRPSPAPAALRRLARLYGVQPSYRDLAGRVRAASPEALLAVLRASGAPLVDGRDAEDALRERRRELARRVAPPSAVAWRGRPAGLRLRSRGDARRVDCRLELEEGGALAWTARWDELPMWSRGRPAAGPGEGRRLPLPGDLPHGCHRLTVRLGGAEGRTRLVVAPARVWGDPESGPSWGAFLPLYAARSRDSWGTGRFADLATLAGPIGRRGGGLVATLPLLAALLDVPFSPAPYAPATRMLWNELFVDLEDAVRESGDAESRALLADSGTRAEIEALRGSPLVDYGRAAALHHRLLAPLARRFFDSGRDAGAGFRRFRDETPEAAEYARFRAAGERFRAPWRAWPEGARRGELGPDDFDPAAARRHLFAQWLAHRQLGRAVKEAGRAGCRLGLDLPLGVHPDGFDPWRERGLYAEGVSAGAPPDPFAAGGQEWGVPPLLPGALVADGFRHYRRILGAHMRHAGLLRVDHVMGLHRLFWVPAGMGAHEGVYVRYPAEELYAVLALESWRHRCEVVGEDLGTVPVAVRTAMRERGVLRSWVLMFELPSHPGEDPTPIPEDAVASIGTHDLFPFAAFWEGLDVEDRLARTAACGTGAAARGAAAAPARGVTAGPPAPAPDPSGARERAARARSGLADFLRRTDRLTGQPTPRAALAASLAWLASSPARHVLVSLEDLWGEREPQNVPGTAEERPNWRRRARLSAGEIAADPEVGALLDAVARERRRARGREGQTR